MPPGYAILPRGLANARLPGRNKRADDENITDLSKGAVIVITNSIHRRAILAGAAAIAAGHAMRPSVVRAEGAAPKGYVLAANEGEHLIQRGGNIFIKADPTRGAGGLGMGTQQILTNVGIPVHRHFEMD